MKLEQKPQRQEYTLPLPPGLNNMYPTVVMAGKPRRVTSSRGKVWKQSARDIIERIGHFVYEGQVSVELVVYRSNVQSDLDGFIKPTLDALTGLCYNDDKQVAVIHAIRFTDRELPGVRVLVEELDEWPV